MSSLDTIYAVATGSGRAAISVVRLSGQGVGAVLKGLAGSQGAPRKLVVRDLVDPSTGELLDRAVTVWLPGPNSYTGEDCAELHVHASSAVLTGLFSALRQFKSVRLAEAGEFTRRAFLNGKIDLVEAEGLGDLLESRTKVQRRQALGRMAGRASSIFDSWRERLLLIRANIEAAVDFVDEEGVADLAIPGVDEDIEGLVAALCVAVEGSDRAEAIRSGIKVVLAGHPNTGKSSLLNALVGREAAIVSAIPGTTRDAIEVLMDVGGFPVRVTDTAGLRGETNDEIELLGMVRTRKELQEADIVLWVCSPDVVGSEVVEEGNGVDLIVLGKSDLRVDGLGLLRNKTEELPVVEISALHGSGLDELTACLNELVEAQFSAMEDSVVVGGRQRDAIEESIRLLNDALDHNAGALELKAEDVRRAANAIGRITGRTEVEEWLGAIFSKFCIGK